MDKKKLSVVFLSLSYGRVNRGAETFIKEVSERLTNMGLVVDIISGRQKHAKRWPLLWRFYVDAQGIQVLFFSLRSLFSLLSRRYDVVVPLDSGWQVRFIRLITWFYGGKMVVSGQSGRGWDDRNNLWCFPDTFVALNNELLRWAKKTNPFVKCERIPNGVDLNKFKDKGSSIDVSLQRPIILSVGALVLEKRLDLAIKAVSKIKSGSLLIVGEGPERFHLENLANRILKKRFLIKSFSHDDMPAAYRACDLFLYPTSSWESFGISMIEAMASGLAVVATEDPIRSEIVGDAGILVNPKSADEFSHAIEEALKIKWGLKPRYQAEKFDWDKIANDYYKLLINL